MVNATILLAMFAAFVVASGYALATDYRPARYVIMCGAALGAVATAWQGWEQYGYESGGDSYCTVDIRFYGRDINNYDLAEWWLEHHGSYPVYDVEVSIEDTTLMGETLRSHLPADARQMHEEMESATSHYRLGTIPPTIIAEKITHGDQSIVAIPSSPRVLKIFSLSPSGAHDFRIEVTSRNGLVIQQWAMRRVGDHKWLAARKSTRYIGPDSRPITEREIPPGFPAPPQNW